MTMSVLYDVPGPVTRRRTAIGTAIAAVALVGLIVLVLIQLGANGQLDGAKWRPLFNPANPYFVSMASDAKAAAATLAAYAVGLIPFVLIRSSVATFFARGDTATPVKAAPMMIPTARSTTLPRIMKPRNSAIQEGDLGVSIRIRPSKNDAESFTRPYLTENS